MQAIKMSMDTWIKRLCYIWKGILQREKTGCCNTICRNRNGLGDDHMLQPGRAETRTCLMTQGCDKLHPHACPSKHAKWTHFGRDMLSAPLHCLPLCPFPWKQNKMFLINSRVLTLLSLYGMLMKLPSIAIS